MEQLRSKINQLLVEQSAARSAFTRSFATKPAADLEKSLGRIFGLIDIGSAEAIAEDFFHLVVEELRQNYYYTERLPGAEVEAEPDIEAHWERALQKTNLSIAAFLESEQVTIDLGKINICVGVVRGEQLHLSWAGRIYAILLHPSASGSHRIVTIVDGASAALQAPNPLKLFSQLISGRLRQRDVLVLATNSVLDYFSLDRIKNLLTQQPVLEGLASLKELMPKADLRVNFGVMAIEVQKAVALATTPAIRPSPPPANPAQPQGLKDSIKQFIRTQQETEKLLSPRLLPELKKYGATIQTWLGTIARRWPRLRDQQKIHWPASRTQTSPTPASPRPLVSRRRVPPFLRTLTRLANTLFRAVIITPLRALADQIRNFLQRFPPRQRRALLLAGLATLVLVITSTWLGLRNARLARETALRDGLARIESMKNEAAASLIYRDEGQAREQLSQAKARLAELKPSTDPEQADINRLNDSIETELEKLRHRYVLEEPVLLANASNLDPNAQAQPFLAGVGSQLIGQLSSGKFFKLELATQVLAPLSDRTQAKPFTISTILRPGEILLATQTGQAGILNTQTGSIRQTTIALPNGSAVGDLATYIDRLYVLDSKGGQIYRTQASDTGLKQLRPWLATDQRLLDQGRSVTVDGALYALEGSSITKLENGRRVDFSQQFIDPPLERPTKLRAFQKSKFLYVLDPTERRVVVIGKDGTLVAQYTSTEFSDLKDMVIDEAQRKLYLLAGNKVFAVPLEHIK